MTSVTDRRATEADDAEPAFLFGSEGRHGQQLRHTDGMGYVARLVTVAALVASCTSGGRTESRAPVQSATADWATAGQGSEGGRTWTLESRGNGPDGVCVRLRLQPAFPSVSQENCQSLQGDHLPVLMQSNEPFGYIYGITGPRVTEVRASFDHGGERAQVTGQAFMLVTRDAFAIKSIAAFAGSTRLASVECADGGC